MRHQLMRHEQESVGSDKVIGPDTEIRNASSLIREFLTRSKRVGVEAGGDTLELISFHNTVPPEIQQRVLDEFGIENVERDESFILSVDKSKIDVYSATERGRLYAGVTLERLMVNGGVEVALAFDYPTCGTRAIRVHLPGIDQIDCFKQLIDMIVYYRYNTIIIEVGGGMDYLSHPEINQGWEEYCAELSASPTKVDEVKSGFDWFKNAMHLEVGGGVYVSQSVVKELVAYCKELQLDVIPEVPSLSHSDYMLTKHRELAERERRAGLSLTLRTQGPMALS